MGLTYTQAAKFLNVSVPTIQDWLSVGLLGRDKNAKRGVVCPESARAILGTRPFDRTRAKWDRAFFSRQDPVTAYWAGFLFADGSLQTTSGGSPRLSVNLAAKDLGHLQRFAEAIGLGKDKVLPNNSGQYYVTVRDPDYLDDLAKWGITKNKTYQFVQPQVPKDILGHFLRGFFDGDGDAWMSGQCPGLRMSSCKEAVRWVESAFRELGYTGNFSINAPKGKMWARTGIFGFIPVALAYDLLHAENLLRLDRKWVLVERRLESYDWRSPRIPDQTHFEAAVRLVSRLSEEKRKVAKKAIARTCLKNGFKLPDSWKD
jgi:hypothetical protein